MRTDASYADLHKSQLTELQRHSTVHPDSITPHSRQGVIGFDETIPRVCLRLPREILVFAVPFVGAPWPNQHCIVDIKPP